MEAYLTRVVDYLLAQSWQIAVLTLAVAVATFALRRRSAHIRYLLWLIVLAKCLVPPLYGVPLGILPPETRADGRSFALVPEMFADVAEVGESAQAPVDTTRAEPAKPGTTSAGTSARVPVTRWLAIAWFAGAGVYLLMNALRALRANFWLRKKRRELPAKLQTDIQELFAAYNLKRFPKIWLIDGMSQPFVWGVLRGSIYLPADFANVNNPAHRRNVLGHELSHVLRFDAAVNLLQVIAQAMFWFHPFVWWANKKVRAEREKCCDEMAIARLNALPRDYSTAIVEILTVRNKSTRPVPSLAVAGPVKNIEERVRTMLRPGKKFYKRPSLTTTATALVLACLIVPTALVLTARAEVKAAAEQQQKPAKSLHQAAAEGDIEQVKLHLSQGADVNAKDRVGRTALHRAAYEGHADLVRLLIDRGADVNAKNRNQGTPLHSAAMKADNNTIELLLSKGADINAKNRRGCTPLFVATTSTSPGRKEVAELLVAKGAKVPAFHLAAYMGDMKKLRKCLQDGIDINSQDDVGITALHLAANSGEKDIVRFLISKGAHVDAKGPLGWTPLLYAASHNYQDIVDLLLAKGADVNAKDKYGYTLLYYAIWYEEKHAVQLLISKGADVNAKAAGDDYTPLVYAIWMDDKDIVELLINEGANINTEDKHGYTPFYWAALQGSKDLAELLTAKGATAVSTIHLAAATGDLGKVKKFIEQGTHIDAKDNLLGLTALQWAISLNHKDVVAFLIDKGADINVGDKRGQTPLHKAALSGHRDVAELLISKGTDINATTAQGWEATPLHCAVTGGHKEMVELLLDKGADLNAKDKGGRTPLHVATWQGRNEMIELLIDKGADIEAKNKWGGTPLHDAAQQGHVETANLLLAKGADLNAENNWGGTPLDIALEQGHKEILELLRKHGAKFATSLGATPLHEAAAGGDIQQVKSLISKGADLHARDGTGKTPLHLAARFGQTEVAETLIAKGADIHSTDNQGGTPMVLAAYEGHRNTVELLVSKGADIEHRNIWGNTPLNQAAGNGHLEVTKFLLGKGAQVDAKNYYDQTPLHAAIRSGFKEMAELLLANGADIRAKRYERTPIGEAMASDQKDMVKLLMGKGVDFSPVHVAAYSGEIEEIKNYLAKGGDINKQDPSEMTLLACAICGGQTAVLEYLLNRGADVNLKGGFGMTALHWSCIVPRPEAVKLLLAKGADVRLRDKTGCIALHRAVYNAPAEIVEMLIKKGSDVNAQSDIVETKGSKDSGWTPLHSAAVSPGRGSIVELLIANGADIQAKTQKGETALSLARKMYEIKGEMPYKQTPELLRKHGAEE